MQEHELASRALGAGDPAMDLYTYSPELITKGLLSHRTGYILSYI